MAGTAPCELGAPPASGAPRGWEGAAVGTGCGDGPSATRLLPANEPGGHGLVQAIYFTKLQKSVRRPTLPPRGGCPGAGQGELTQGCCWGPRGAPGQGGVAGRPAPPGRTGSAEGPPELVQWAQHGGPLRRQPWSPHLARRAPGCVRLSTRRRGTAPSAGSAGPLPGRTACPRGCERRGPPARRPASLRAGETGHGQSPPLPGERRPPAAGLGAQAPGRFSSPAA